MGLGPEVGVSVGAVTDIGPRAVNADRHFTSQCTVDDSWVIAVADGVGSHPQAPDAAAAAVEALPGRIDSLDAMRDAFVAASERVVALAPSWDDFMATKRARFGDDERFDALSGSLGMIAAWSHQYTASCPLCTLCVAAWTPTGGLLVASVGDTLAFEVRWPPAGSPRPRLIADPHRAPPMAQGVESFLGCDPIDPRIRDDYGGLNRYFAAVRVDAPTDPGMAIAVIVASDGAWEPLWPVAYAAEYTAESPEERRWYSEPVTLPDGWPGAPIDCRQQPPPPLYRRHSGPEHRLLAPAVASAAGPAAEASVIADRVLDAARTLGLDDNATVAAATMTPL